MYMYNHQLFCVAIHNVMYVFYLCKSFTNNNLEARVRQDLQAPVWEGVEASATQASGYFKEFMFVLREESVLFTLAACYATADSFSLNVLL